MMALKWTSKAIADLERLHAFLASSNKTAAARAVHTLTAAPRRLVEHPRIGEKLDEFEPRDVRRLLIGPCEMRYEIQSETIFVLRFWHTRESR